MGFGWDVYEETGFVRDLMDAETVAVELSLGVDLSSKSLTRQQRHSSTSKCI